MQVSVNEKEDKHALHQLMYVIVKVWYNFVNTIELCITKATLANLLQSVVISPFFNFFCCGVIFELTDGSQAVIDKIKMSVG